MPASPPVMRQTWCQLLFLHWAVEPDVVRSRLPQGLKPDLYDGSAWIGVVPFAMRNVRPAGLPPVPWLSDFLELNVRTYAVDAAGRPGVWFDSLDCNQPVAVGIARRFFHLNYRHARMRASETGGRVLYRSQLMKDAGPIVRFDYEPTGSASEAVLGSLDFFLVERYRLFAASRRGALFTGRVHHAPYRIRSAVLHADCAEALQLAGLSPELGQPAHICYSDGVDVGIHAMEVL